jgi:DNA-binding HxlR family transcriptional regulator
VIRRRYSLAVMNAILQHQPARYREIAQRLPQASSSTLAETLSALTAANLVRHETADSVPTATYALTAAGEKLLSRLRRLLEEIQQ